MNHFNNGTYFFTSTLNSTKDSDNFVIELYSTGTDMTDLETSIPEKVIHNFDELISFFEEIDEEEQAEKIESKETVMI